MMYVTSADGTTIALEKLGEGPAIVLVGGSLADHGFYAPLATELADEFTVYNFDRRGRGESGDTQPYAVEREIEDVAALIGESGQSAYVYGHSAGSALALRAAAAGLPIAKLVLADPPYSPRGGDDEAAVAEHAEQAAHISKLNSKGEYRASAKFFMKDYGLTDDELDEMLSAPGADTMIDSARALPYDYAVLGDGLVPTELAAKVTVPTMIMAAGAMPDTAQALVKIMPNAELKLMEASAHELSPNAVAQAVRAFFRQP